MSRKRFALIGAAGFVAPRHMRAIKENNCDLLAAVDPFDSVGIIDSYFPESAFFTEVERFDRYIDKLKRTDNKIDYFSICSPNYLHDAHIRLSLRNGCDAICEKPLVVNPENLKYLKTLEHEMGKKVYTILQLRYHPVILQLKNDYKKKKKKKANIDLTYITSRGQWYHHSWKGQDSKSGGLAANIGIHFFDMLIWIFGDVLENIVHSKEAGHISGLLKLDNADVKWNLSINGSDLPKNIVESGKSAYRNIIVNGKDLNFSSGFKNLHTVSYEDILKGNGFGIEDSAQSLYLVNEILKYKV